MDTTDIRVYLELLEVYKFGLSCCIVEKQEVISWADKIVSNDRFPENFIIELSLSGSDVNKMISIIHDYIGNQKIKLNGRAILALLYHKLVQNKVSMDTVIRTMNSLHSDSGLSDIESNLLFVFDNNYEMIGITNIDEDKTTTEIFDFLYIYKDFSLDNFKDWRKYELLVSNKVVEFIKNYNYKIEFK